MRSLKTLKKKRLVFKVCKFGCRETVGKIKDRSFFLFWFQFVFFYFGLCFEFLIELLKKIETLLFFEIGLCF